MPAEAAAAVVPTPTSHPNSPQNGAPPPAAGATTQTQPPESGATDIVAKYKQLETEHQKKVREHIIERRKWEGDRKTLSERATKAAEYEKSQQRARLNPPEFLKSIYGDDWHAVLTEAKVNGVPPAQLIEQEMQKLRDEFAEKERAREESGLKSQEAQKEQATAQARQTIFAECAQFYRAKAAEFPIFAQVKGGEPAVAKMLSQRIEAEFHETGKILTTAEVAALVEGEVLEWAIAAGKHEKYKPKLQPSGVSSTVSSSKQQQGTQQPAAARRSISNNITGSTSPATPPASAKEKRARVEAAYEAARLKR